MKFRALPLFVCLLFLAAGTPAEQCDSNSNSVEVSWSEPRTIVLPDCMRSIHFIPEGGDIAEARLRSRDGTVDVRLFSVERSGTLHWNGPDILFFEDRRYSNSYRLLLFDLVNPKHSVTTALEVDALVRRRVVNELGTAQTIVFYFPKFVSWTTEGLAISVGVETTHGPSGPFSFHCFGFELGIKPGRIVSAIGENGLRSRYQASCQEFP